MIQKLTPLRIATEQCWGVGVQARPAGQILLGEREQFRLLSQSRSGTAAQLKADFVYQLVTHADSLVGRLVEVNATTERSAA